MEAEKKVQGTIAAYENMIYGVFPVLIWINMVKITVRMITVAIG
jgi:hypothetical protein